MNNLSIVFLILFGIANSAFSQDSEKEEIAKAEAFDAMHVDYVHEAIGNNKDFKALLIGSAVTTSMLESSYDEEEYEKLELLAQCIVAGSDEVGRLVSDYSGLPYYVAKEYCNIAFDQKGSSEYFMFISTVDDKISRYISALTLNTVVTARRHPGKKSDSEFFCYPKSLFDLLGETKDAGFLFIGDAVILDSVVNPSVTDLWTKLEKKTDLVVVFSEKMKQAVESKTSLSVIMSTEDYDFYFVEPESFMKKWLWFVLKDGNMDNMIASTRGNDLVRNMRGAKKN